MQFSSVAQLVEQAAVNRFVAGSSPARGAIFLNFLFKIFPTIDMINNHEEN